MGDNVRYNIRGFDKTIFHVYTKSVNVKTRVCKKGKLPSKPSERYRSPRDQDIRIGSKIRNKGDNFKADMKDCLKLIFLYGFLSTFEGLTKFSEFIFFGTFGSLMMLIE